MKIPCLFFVTLSISLFSAAETVTETNKSIIKPSNVSSWNHISQKQDVYAGLNQASHRYQLKKKSGPSATQTQFELILVKKLLDWHEQHSNGIEVSLKNLELSVQQLKQLHFKIKLSSADSIITAKFESLKRQNPWLEKSDKFNELLSEQAHFTLIFYGENHDNPKQKTLYGAYPFKLNFGSKQQWQTIDISPENINYYWQQNYQEQPVASESINTQMLKGFILVAESGNNKVVRNYMPNSFPKKHTEVFNEFDIALTDLHITLSP